MLYLKQSIISLLRKNEGVTMANEAKTSIIFRELLRKAKYYDDADTIVEEQKSDNAKIDSLMKNASKRGEFFLFLSYSGKLWRYLMN